jgi:dolichol-phosphate mannosyltransferase
MRKTVIVLPTYNEQENIKTLIPTIFKIAAKIKNWQISILVVDDKSSDNTSWEVKCLQKKYPNLYLIQERKEGLGKAYWRGFCFALKKINPSVIFGMDADWSHDPNLIPQFLKKIEEGADFVIGARYIKGGSIPKDWFWHRKLFSILGNLICRLGFMTFDIHDWTSGFRAIKGWFLKEILSQMKHYNGYVFQVALLEKAKKKGLIIAEIPLNFKDRKKGKSKINSFQYIFNTLLYIFLNSSFIKFVIVGMIGFTIDFAISYLLIEKIKWAVWLSTIISAETAIISNFFLNNFWSFSHKKIKGRFFSYCAKFGRFNLVSLGSVIIQSLLLQWATMIFPLKFWFVYKGLIIIFLIVPYSYYLYNHLIWKKNNSS